MTCCGNNFWLSHSWNLRAREGEYCFNQPEGLHVQLTHAKGNLLFSVSSRMLPKNWCSTPDMWHWGPRVFSLATSLQNNLEVRVWCKIYCSGPCLQSWAFWEAGKPKGSQEVSSIICRYLRGYGAQNWSRYHEQSSCLFRKTYDTCGLPATSSVHPPSAYGNDFRNILLLWSTHSFFPHLIRSRKVGGRRLYTSEGSLDINPQALCTVKCM